MRLETSKPKSCEHCGDPLPVPRRANTRYHPDCFSFVDSQRSAKRWASMSEETKEAGRESARKRARKRRQEVIDYYGGECECCGENRFEFLSIDHINGGGRQHQKEIGTSIIKWLRKNNYPSGFRVLCHNCNMSYGMYGYCLH